MMFDCLYSTDRGFNIKTGEVNNVNVEFDMLGYFSLYGPFSVLFVSLFYWTLKTYTHREDIYRRELQEMRSEINTFTKQYNERSKEFNEVIIKFADKLELVNEVYKKVNNIETKLDNKEI